MDRTQGQAEPDERPTGPSTAPARVVTLTAGDFTLTVNPVDGSEIEPLRPGTRTGRPAKRDTAARRARNAAARPPALPGAPLPARPLLEREEEKERLVRLLSRGRSVRLTGPAGSGRTSLLDAVAAACESLAPDGVVRLSGHGQQQPVELLHALYAAVYESSDERPDRIELLSRVRDIGAVVLLDDLEMGGTALDELLRATPECAYLLATTPETRAPSDDSHLEEVFLGGLGKADCLLLLEAGLGRPLTDAETVWAGDLRFASEGLPLRFVQAAALLRQRDELNRTDEDDDEEEPGVFEERPRDAVQVPLPTSAEGANPAELLASRVSESARAALRIACALGGEMPHHTHLPALVGDTHADAAVAELLACGLLTPVGTRYRLAAGVARRLEEAGYGETAPEEARTAARHYAWWTGHASVPPERVAAEADAVLAALTGADVVAAVLLARTAAPAFAAALHWEAWERVLRAGAEAARKAGEVAEQAYFHHELGVLALCEGRLDRARAELETSTGLRGALADKRGTVAGRRALALVADREAAEVAVSPPLRLEPPAVTAGGAGGVAAAPGGAVAGAGAAGGGVVGAVAAGAGRGTAGVTGTGTGTGTGAGTAKPGAGTNTGTGTDKPVGALGAGAGAGAGAAAVGGAGTGAGTAAGTGIGTGAGAGGAFDVVTRITPVVPVTGRPVAPTTLSEAFEDAFPLTPKKPFPAVAATVTAAPAVHGPGTGPARRKPLLLAAAGALAVVVVGTVAALAMSSSETPAAPKGPAVSSTPSPAVPPLPASTGGNDPAPVPADSQAPAEPPVTEEGVTPAPGQTRAGTPSRRPSATPSKSTAPTSQVPVPSTTAPPVVTPTPTPTVEPTPTGPTGPGPGDPPGPTGGEV
ncbi:ATP-binding protein [Streptomyces sp. NPDC058662]|uniref:ATP-binding protein n=1 Tax=Streptomyces sp. NPDC058662 TaxID=3346583 RepID=UPI003663FB98